MSSSQMKQIGTLLASVGLGFVSANGYRAYKEQSGGKSHFNSTKADLQAPKLSDMAQMANLEEETKSSGIPHVGDDPHPTPDPVDEVRPEEVNRDGFNDLDLKIRDPKTEEVIGSLSIKIKGTIEIPEMPIGLGQEEAILGGNKVEDLGQIVLDSREITNAAIKFL